MFGLLVGEPSLRFYQVVQLIKCHCNVSEVDIFVLFVCFDKDANS
jgi:hypothetical protein